MCNIYCTLLYTYSIGYSWNPPCVDDSANQHAAYAHIHAHARIHIGDSDTAPAARYLPVYHACMHNRPCRYRFIVVVYVCTTRFFQYSRVSMPECYIDIVFQSAAIPLRWHTTRKKYRYPLFDTLDFAIFLLSLVYVTMIFLARLLASFVLILYNKLVRRRRRNEVFIRFKRLNRLLR